MKIEEYLAKIDNEFDEIFGETLWQGVKIKNPYTGEAPQYYGASEKVKYFIHKAITEAVKEVKQVPCCGHPCCCGVAKGGEFARFKVEGTK